MRRAGAVALAVLLAALALGLLRMDQDIDSEVDAAMTLAAAMARLAGLAQATDADALAVLRALQAEHPPRHLLLLVHDEDGQLLLAPPEVPSPPAPLRWLLALHQRWLSAPDRRQVSWPLPRPDGSRWTVSLAASHDSERREAMANLADMLALMLLCVAGLLLAMRWNLQRALAPLARLLAAIDGIERNDLRSVRALPAMPVGELEAVAGALRHLAAALQDADRQRGLLGRQLQTLQEDERARLAAELHDELGQQLTALRVDAAWLARRLAGNGELQPVVAAMADRCQRIQLDIRGLLARLQPFGASGRDGGDGEVGESPGRLAELLRGLVAGWSATPGRIRASAQRIVLELPWQADAQCAPMPWPPDPADNGGGGTPLLPRVTALTLYRISQEALTNVARHAGAGTVMLRMLLVGPWRAGAALRIDWSIDDDGVGIDDPRSAMQRGNGLAGLRDRLLAQGAELQLTAAADGDARPGLARPGLRLSATLHTRWLPSPPAREGDDAIG